jgi:hypothetical protein
MFNFFKNIFTPTNNKKSTSSDRNDDKNKIYFERNKENFLEVKIFKEYTCQDIHSQYHSEILSELMRHNSFSSSTGYNRILNSNEFAFIIIDDENPYCEIKLKMKDNPSRLMNKPSINLYYLNINQSKNDETSTDKLEETNANPINSTNRNKYNQNIPLNNGEYCLREGELLKYSLKHKRFDKRLLTLDKEKLIITKPKNKGRNLFLIE